MNFTERLIQTARCRWTDALFEDRFGRAWPKGLGRVLAVIFAIMCIGGSFGGGNMFQSNQSYSQVASVIPALDGPAGAWIYGLGLALLVGIVIIGGSSASVRLRGSSFPLCADCTFSQASGFW